MTIAEDPAAQARQALRNIDQALAEAGAGLADVVRARYYLPDAADWPAVAAVLGEAFGAIRPAATALICGLIDPRMKIEIEVTARRLGAARPADQPRAGLRAADAPARLAREPPGCLIKNPDSRCWYRGVGTEFAARSYTGTKALSEGAAMGAILLWLLGIPIPIIILLLLIWH